MVPKEMHISELAYIIGVDKDLIRKWLYLFEEYFSPGAAHPQNGRPRIFNDQDIRRLLVIAYAKDWWGEDDDGDYTRIHSLLNSSDEFDDHFLHEAFLKAPLFQPMPDKPEEMYPSSIVLGESWVGSDFRAIAESFKLAGDVLLKQALDSGEPWGLDYPILYCYRHSIELFLKAVVKPCKINHNLPNLINALENHFGAKIRPDIKNILDQFAEIDPNSTTFRYGEGKLGEGFPCDEARINLYQLFLSWITLPKVF